jgi:uncharacterized phage infection (PIP) family protein YhgE
MEKTITNKENVFCYLKRTINFNTFTKSPFRGFRGMAELESNIKRINDKLQKLLKNYQQLQKDNDRQSRLIKELQEIKEKNNHHITQMQQQVGILKSAAGQMSASDKKNFETHINQYIKEIDKCIGLLSE